MIFFCNVSSSPTDDYFMYILAKHTWITKLDLGSLRRS